MYFSNSNWSINPSYEKLEMLRYDFALLRAFVCPGVADDCAFVTVGDFPLVTFAVALAVGALVGLDVAIALGFVSAGSALFLELVSAEGSFEAVDSIDMLVELVSSLLSMLFSVGTVEHPAKANVVINKVASNAFFIVITSFRQNLTILGSDMQTNSSKSPVHERANEGGDKKRGVKEEAE